MVTSVGKLCFSHILPLPTSVQMLTKRVQLTHKCILPFSNVESGNGGADTYLVVITIIISSFCMHVFQLKLSKVVARHEFPCSSVIRASNLCVECHRFDCFHSDCFLCPTLVTNWIQLFTKKNFIYILPSQ